MSRTLPTSSAPKMRRVKLSDQIAEDLRRWIVRENLGPKDRLPNERALQDHYGCSRGTMREALKALEVEGLLIMHSGPNGGPEVQQTSAEIASRQLRQFLHFQKLDFKHVYELRRSMEVALALNVVDRLTAEHLTALEDNIRLCENANNEQERELARQAEVEFHDILAEASDNPILVFICQFLNGLIRDLVDYRAGSLQEHEAFGARNVAYHKEILAAFKARDRDAVAKAMDEHMCCAETSMQQLDAAFYSDLLSRR
ncbi:FadR/GntR family transcriptional regulator [Pseudorhodobacter turbinis]|nr:FCD domain-containing protein [Pseudorhodobacter turbinis]